MFQSPPTSEDGDVLPMKVMLYLYKVPNQQPVVELQSSDKLKKIRISPINMGLELDVANTNIDGSFIVYRFISVEDYSINNMHMFIHVRNSSYSTRYRIKNSPNMYMLFKSKTLSQRLESEYTLQSLSRLLLALRSHMFPSQMLHGTGIFTINFTIIFTINLTITFTYKTEPLDWGFYVGKNMPAPWIAPWIAAWSIFLCRRTFHLGDQID